MPSSKAVSPSSLNPATAGRSGPSASINAATSSATMDIDTGPPEWVVIADPLASGAMMWNSSASRRR